MVIMIKQWVFLRGLARESGHWGHFPQQFEKAVPESRVITLDLPGTGKQRDVPSPTEISSIVDNVRSQLGPQKEQYNILGLSLGGMVAWEWMLRHPEEIGAGVLINSSFSRLSFFHARMRWQILPRFLLAASQPQVERREAKILDIVSQRKNHHQETLKDWIKLAYDRPISVDTTLRQIIAAAQYSPDHLAPICPVLILSAMGDQLVHPNCSQKIAETYHLPHQVHPWAGHDLTLDDPDWVAHQIIEWLQNC